MALFFLFSRDPLTLGSRLIETRVRTWIAPVHQKQTVIPKGMAVLLLVHEAGLECVWNPRSIWPSEFQTMEKTDAVW